MLLLPLTRIPYSQPATEVYAISSGQVVCLSEYETENVESPHAPGKDNAW